MTEVENKTYSGVGKDFSVPKCCLEPIEYELRDVKGRSVRKGEEYFFLEQNDRIVIVHIEEVANYLDDERLYVEDFDVLIKLMEVHYDAYPQIM